MKKINERGYSYHVVKTDLEISITASDANAKYAAAPIRLETSPS